MDENASPLFNLRGIQPFHDFTEGPDWWTTDDYKAIIGQLPKMRMNFIGLHTYPENWPHAEPTVWIGLPGDYDAKGKVTFGYPSSYNNTLRTSWNYLPKKTIDYGYGASQLFETDAYGSTVQGTTMPWPTNQTEYQSVFNLTGELLNAAFTYAHQLGIKTCVGTEGPLTVPALVKFKMAQQGKSVAEVYEGTFDRIKKTYPLDYYWIWTNEGWTWNGAFLIDETKADITLASSAIKKINAPFKLATSGWALGPENNRTMFDSILPIDFPMSAINQNTGETPIDPALTIPQLWVNRVKRDANDAFKYDCTGLMGIHWRTREIGANISAL